MKRLQVGDTLCAQKFFMPVVHQSCSDPCHGVRRSGVSSESQTSADKSVQEISALIPIRVALRPGAIRHAEWSVRM